MDIHLIFQMHLSKPMQEKNRNEKKGKEWVLIALLYQLIQWKALCVREQETL